MKMFSRLVVAFACLQMSIYPGQALASNIALLPETAVNLPHATLLATTGDAIGEYDRNLTEATVEAAKQTEGQLQQAADRGETTVDGDRSDVAIGGTLQGEPQATGYPQAAVTRGQAEAQIETRESVEEAKEDVEEATDKLSESADNAVDASQAQAEAAAESIDNATDRAQQKVAEDINRVEETKEEAGSRLEAAAEDFAEGFRDLFGQGQSSDARE